MPLAASVAVSRVASSLLASHRLARAAWQHPTAARPFTAAATGTRRPLLCCPLLFSSAMGQSKQKSLDAFFKKPAATKAESDVAEEQPEAGGSGSAAAAAPSVSASMPQAAHGEAAAAAAAAGGSLADPASATAAAQVTEAQRMRAHANRNLALARQVVTRAEAAAALPRLGDLLVEGSWREALAGEMAKPYWNDLEAFVRSEWGGSQMVFPPKHAIFRCACVWGLCCVPACLPSVWRGMFWRVRYFAGAWMARSECGCGSEVVFPPKHAIFLCACLVGAIQVCMAGAWRAVCCPPGVVHGVWLVGMSACAWLQDASMCSAGSCRLPRRPAGRSTAAPWTKCGWSSSGRTPTTHSGRRWASPSLCRRQAVVLVGWCVFLSVCISVPCFLPGCPGCPGLAWPAAGPAQPTPLAPAGFPGLLQGVKVPSSLKNMYKEMREDLGCEGKWLHAACVHAGCAGCPLASGFRLAGAAPCVPSKRPLSRISEYLPTTSTARRLRPLQ